MQLDVSQPREFCVARIHPPYVASERRLPATRIVCVIKVVVPLWVRTERRVVDVGREHQRGTTAPPANEFRGEQFAFGFGVAVRLEKSIERSNARLIFSKAYIRAVATKNFRLRHRQRKARLTRISQNELSSFDWFSLTGKRVNATALDRGLVDTVFVTQ